MGGKVKNKDDGGVQSKTARASMRGSAQKEEYVASADASRIVPLGGGTHAYVFDPKDGRTLRVPVASEALIEALVRLVGTNHGDRVRRDVAELASRYPSWETVIARLDAALAPPVPEAETADVGAGAETPEVAA